MARDALAISVPHADLVHDVTDKDCQIQHGRTHGRLFLNFKRRFLTSRVVSRLKNYYEYINSPSPPPIHFDSSRDKHMLRVPFNIAYVADMK